MERTVLCERVGMGAPREMYVVVSEIEWRREAGKNNGRCRAYFLPGRSFDAQDLPPVGWASWGKRVNRTENGAFHALVCFGAGEEVTATVSGNGLKIPDVQLLFLHGAGPWNLYCQEVNKLITWSSSGLIRSYTNSSDLAETKLHKLTQAYGLLHEERSPFDMHATALQHIFDVACPCNLLDGVNPRHPKTWIARVGMALECFGNLPIPSVVKFPYAFIMMNTFVSQVNDKQVVQVPYVQLKDISLVASFMHTRGLELQEFAVGDDADDPANWLVSQRRARHIFQSFVLDMALGLLFGLLVSIYSTELGDALYNSFGYALQSEVMEQRIRWVLSQHAPLGFKLNSQLDQILGETVLLVVQFWHELTALLAPLAPQLMATVGIAAALGGGISLIIALAGDAVVLLTLHVQFLINFFGRMHRFQLSALSTFSKVVQGKKKNVLRKRVDTGEFDTGQLLLGSLGFIVVCFVFQTTLAYYLMFSVLWLLVAMVHSILVLGLVFIDLFPCESIRMVVLNRRIFPNGIQLLPITIPKPRVVELEYMSALSIKGNYIGVGILLSTFAKLLLTCWLRRWRGKIIGVLFLGKPLVVRTSLSASHSKKEE